jgi:hypothetical protein
VREGPRPQTLLLVLVGAIPLAVAVAVGAAALLLRAGYGIFVGALLPLAGLLVVAAAMGILLGRAAGGRGRTSDRSRGRDDV